MEAIKEKPRVHPERIPKSSSNAEQNTEHTRKSPSFAYMCCSFSVFFCMGGGNWGAWGVFLFCMGGCMITITWLLFNREKNSVQSCFRGVTGPSLLDLPSTPDPLQTTPPSWSGPDLDLKGHFGPKSSPLRGPAAILFISRDACTHQL